MVEIVERVYFNQLNPLNLLNLNQLPQPQQLAGKNGGTDTKDIIR